MTVAGLAVAIGISTAVFSTVKAVTFGGYGIADARVGVSGRARQRLVHAGRRDLVYQGNWRAAPTTGVSRTRHRRSPSSPRRHDGARYAATPRRAATRCPSACERSPAPTSRRSGCGPSLGRLLTPADDVPGAATAVVGHGFWKNRLGGDAAVIGRTVWLNGHAFTVVGVADRTHSSPSYSPAPAPPSG